MISRFQFGDFNLTTRENYSGEPLGSAGAGAAAGAGAGAGLAVFFFNFDLEILFSVFVRLFFGGFDFAIFCLCDFNLYYFFVDFDSAICFFYSAICFISIWRFFVWEISIWRFFFSISIRRFCLGAFYLAIANSRKKYPIL